MMAAPRIHGARLPFLLGVVGATALLWAAFVLLTGGFSLDAGGLRLSSHNWRTPAGLALLAIVAEWVVSSEAARRNIVAANGSLLSPIYRGLDRLPARLSWAIAGAAALVVFIAGVTRGTETVGGADVYGYVSQAHLWANGAIRLQQPFVRDMQWSAPLLLWRHSDTCRSGTASRSCRPFRRAFR